MLKAGRMKYVDLKTNPYEPPYKEMLGAANDCTHRCVRHHHGGGTNGTNGTNGNFTNNNENCKTFKDFPVNIVLLTGSTKVAVRKQILPRIKNGEVNLIIGTHALIQDEVQYHKLGLVIIDEQHRFGVHQRQILREKGERPNVLAMTATPIPRTLQITSYGEMDISVIDELPAGRKKIKKLGCGVMKPIKHYASFETINFGRQICGDTLN